MGQASARKEMAADLRRKIGDNAAAAVGELREHLGQTDKNARALAQGLALVEKRIDVAAAATAELRGRVFDCEDRLDAIGLRLQQCPTTDRARQWFLDVENLVRWHIERVDRFEHMTFLQRLRWSLVGTLPDRGQRTPTLLASPPSVAATQRVIE